MRAIIGHSEDIDSEDAILEVIAQCREQLGGDVPKAGLLFTSVDYDHQAILDAVAAEWPGLPLVGGTSDGEVSSREGFTDDSVLLTLLCGDELSAVVGVGHNLSGDIDAAVAQALSALPAGASPCMALTTFAPSTDAAEVLRQIDARLSTVECPVFGGLTGDHGDFIKMREFCGQDVLIDSLPILFIGGDIQVSWGIGSGWIPVGPAFEITSSQAHLLQEIDRRPALDLYLQYYGEVPQGHLGEYPLAVSTDGPDGPWQLRAVLGTDHETGQVRLAGGVTQGSLVRMTEVVAEGVLSGTMKSIDDAIAGFRGQPEIALLFTCAARKWVLGSRAEDELRTVRDAFPGAAGADVGLAGLYVFGEIAPANVGAPSSLHNESCITVLLGAA